MLTIARDEWLDLFQRQPKGAQALDHLHTPERLAAKQAIVAVTSAEGVDEAFIFAQHLDRHPGAPESCPMVIAFDLPMSLILSCANVRDAGSTGVARVVPRGQRAMVCQQAVGVAEF